jgi:glutamate racemase
LAAQGAAEPFSNRALLCEQARLPVPAKQTGLPVALSQGVTRIGVMDSGVGGLSVLSVLAHLRPQTDLVYYADSAHLPYGEKSEAFIKARVLAIGEILIEKEGCGLMVVACNTATAAAIEALRARWPAVPIVGVEPGIKPAAQQSRHGRIAVFATRATIASARLAGLVTRYAAQKTVFLEACPGWADWIEEGGPSHPALLADLDARLARLLGQGVDQLVLGCTHYSFVGPVIQERVKGEAAVIDIAHAVAFQASRLAGPSPPISSSGTVGRLRLLSSAPLASLEKALVQFELLSLQGRL